jgi:hypothetical protein
MSCYLYLLKTAEAFKVGYTTNPKNRWKVYKTHNPSQTLEGLVEVVHKKVEKAVHVSILRQGYRKFPQQREWFLGSLALEDFTKLVEDENNYYKKYN